jgi:hypothetical protein
MSLDLGLVDQGDAVVTLRGTGTLTNNSSFQQDIDAEIAQIDDDIDVSVVPFMSLGFQFRF